MSHTHIQTLYVPLREVYCTCVSPYKILQLSLSIPVRMSALEICRFGSVLLQCVFWAHLFIWNPWNWHWSPGSIWNSYTAKSKRWSFKRFNGSTHGSESSPHERWLKIHGIKIFKISNNKIKACLSFGGRVEAVFTLHIEKGLTQARRFIQTKLKPLLSE